MRLENGYETKTTFWEDFTIADAFGTKAVQDTYDNAFKGWKYNHEYVTELSLVMNWKMFQWYEKNEDLYNLYEKLYYRIDQWCMDNLKGNELEYYLKWTD
jgi:hypothetical protein